jgi:hypothetical protein
MTKTKQIHKLKNTNKIQKNLQAILTKSRKKGEKGGRKQTVNRSPRCKHVNEDFKYKML